MDYAKGDPGREAVERALNRFHAISPFVELPPTIGVSMLDMVDQTALNALRNNEVDPEKFTNGIVSFLVRASLLQAVKRAGGQQLSRALTVQDASVSLDEDALEKAKDRLWCTIWPICPTGT